MRAGIRRARCCPCTDHNLLLGWKPMAHSINSKWAGLGWGRPKIVMIIYYRLLTGNYTVIFLESMLVTHITAAVLCSTTWQTKQLLKLLEACLNSSQVSSLFTVHVPTLLCQVQGRLGWWCGPKQNLEKVKGSAPGSRIGLDWTRLWHTPRRRSVSKRPATIVYLLYECMRNVDSSKQNSKSLALCNPTCWLGASNCLWPWHLCQSSSHRGCFS